jgi:hypothetical protein
MITIEPHFLSEIIGVADDSAADWRPIVCDVVPGQGILYLGSVLSQDPATGKVSLLVAANYANVFGILLETIDTGTDGAATGEWSATVARAGSFFAPKLFVGAGADLKQVATRLRELNISLEGLANWSYVTPSGTEAAAAQAEPQPTQPGDGGSQAHTHHKHKA